MNRAGRAPPPSRARAIVGPGRTYHTGAKKPAVPRVAAERVFEWCLPVYYRENDMGAQTIEVTLGVAPPAGGFQPTDDLSDLAFQVRWGSGENCGPDDPVVEVDAINGTTLALVAYGIEVYYLYPPTTVPGATQPTVDLTVSVGVGARSGVGVTDPARRTVNVGTIPPFSVSPFFLIPRFAVSAVMQNTVGTVPTLVLDQHRVPQVASSLSQAPAGKLDQDSVPVANGARAFSLFNTGATASTGTRMIFYLAP